MFPMCNVLAAYYESSETPDWAYLVGVGICAAAVIVALIVAARKKKRREKLGLPPRKPAPGLPKPIPRLSSMQLTVRPISDSDLTPLMDSINVLVASMGYLPHSQIQKTYVYDKRDEVALGILLLFIFFPIGIYYLWFRKAHILITSTPAETTFEFKTFSLSARRAVIELIESTSSPLPAILIESPDEAEKDKECPYCAETIKAKAIKCRYCGADLPEQD